MTDWAERGKALADSGKYAPSRNGHDHNYPPAAPPDIDDHHASEWNPPLSDAADAGAFDNDAAIQHRLQWLRVNHEARRRLEEETRRPVTLPPLRNLSVLLEEPDPPERYRIDKLAPVNARVMLSAQKKSGKTTFVDNIIRSLVDSDPLLGAFTVNEPARSLVLLDDELSEDMMRRWLRDQRIRNTDAVTTVSLRGRVGTLNLLDDHVRAEWARRLQDLGCDYLVLDCLRPVLDAIGLEEKNVGPFLVAFDALLAEAGITDALVVHHMGHVGERARGDSRLQDWPDANWWLIRDKDQDGGPRYFSAEGRDVLVSEGRLGYDAGTRRLTYAAGSRIDSKTEAAQVAVITLLAAGDALNKTAIETALGADHTQKAIRAAITKTVESGAVVAEAGPRGAMLHRIAHPCAVCGMPVNAGESRHESCPVSKPEGLFE